MCAKTAQLHPPKYPKPSENALKTSPAEDFEHEADAGAGVEPGVQKGLSSCRLE